MSKTIQFRCPKCLRLLLKWEVGSDTLIYKAPRLEIMDTEGNHKKLVCTKCGVWLEITKNGLVEKGLVTV